MRYLYLLTRYDAPDYDETVAFVIRARSADKARKLAARASVDWQKKHWLNPRETKCCKIGEATPGTRQTEGVVLADVKWG